MPSRYIVKDELGRERAKEGLSQAELPLDVTIKPYRRNRSLEQNDMFHGILKVIGDYTGYTVEELKELIMIELGYFEPKQVMGRTIMVRRSTAQMKTDELSELIERTLAWAASNGLPTMR